MTRLLPAFALTLLVAACGSPNGAWRGTQSYVPPERDRLTLSNFALQSSPSNRDSLAVTRLDSGALPITFTQDLVNSGGGDLRAGYLLRMEVLLTALALRGGEAVFEILDPARQTVFVCQRPGPAIPAGGNSTVSFAFPGPNCSQLNPAAPPNPPLTKLPCGLYEARLSVDAGNLIDESSEGDNRVTQVFQVPHPIQSLDISTARNPLGNTRIATTAEVNAVEVRADVVPQPAVTHRHRVNAGPAGWAFVTRAPGPVVAAESGNRLTVSPSTLGMPPEGVIGPQYIDVLLETNAGFSGPLTDSLRRAHVDRMVSGITAVTVDGCQIRQQSHTVEILHQAQ